MSYGCFLSIIASIAPTIAITIMIAMTPTRTYVLVVEFPVEDVGAGVVDVDIGLDT